MVLTDILSFVAIFFIGALIVQVIAFSFSLKLKRVDIVDVAWGASFIAGYLALQIYRPTNSLSVMIVGLMLFAWGARLSIHILRRFLRSTHQDDRYTELMSAWPVGNRAIHTFLRIFLTQAVLATIIGLPIIVISFFEPSTKPIVFIGIVVWVFGYVVEIVGDRQLKQFLLSSKSSGLMTSGLWKYSRHPNYFGEISMWWGIALISCATPLWWLGIIGAMTISYLLSFVSGVPLAEARAATKPGWAAYKEKTSVLVLWPPKQ